MTAELATHVRWAILLTLAVNAASMLTPVISAGDSVVYAAISQHIALTNNWVDLVLDGQDWLDKPHLPFWITAASFRLLGIHAFSYIFPGFLFHLLGGYFVYRITRLLYDDKTALLALLVYVSAYHLMQSSTDVKAEVFLTGSITGACYYWLRYDTTDRLKHLLLGAFFSAAAMMTKGLFTLITVSSGMVCMWLYQRQYAKLCSKKWLCALALSFLLTTPELVALYLQFDAHPEKLVFGQSHVSGIRFFLWDSQFGRFLNTGPIQNHNGDPFFFVHVFLWSFLPWVAVFFAALVCGVRTFSCAQAHERSALVFLLGAFFVTFALFSATRFQMDYYTVILLPFAAILCAHHLTQWLEKGNGVRLLHAQIGTTMLLLAMAVGVAVYVAQLFLLAMVLVAMTLMLGYAHATRRHLRVYAALLYPVFGVNVLYGVLDAVNLHAFTNYSIPYNAAHQLAGRPMVPIYVYQMDLVVARELGLYQPTPCYSVAHPQGLPPRGSDYVFVVRQEQLAQLLPTLGVVSTLAQGDWVDDKAGILPRMLRLAKGVEPLQRISVVRVGEAQVVAGM